MISTMFFIFCYMFFFATTVNSKTKETEVIIHHESRYVTIKVYGRESKKIKGNEVFISPSKIRIKVIETNTPFYKYQLTKKKVEAKELKALQTFLSDLAPYLTDFPRTSISINDAIKLFSVLPSPDQLQKNLLDNLRDNLNESNSNIKKTLGQINTLIFDNRSLFDTYIKTINMLEPISLAPSDAGRQLKIELKDRLSESNSKPIHLIRIKELKEMYKKLNDRLHNFKNKLNVFYEDNQDNTELLQLAEEFGLLRDQAIKALSESQKVLVSGYEIEKLVLKAIEANDKIELEPFNLEWKTGKEITIKITHSENTNLARFAKFKPYEVTINLQPRSTLRPSVGLSFIWSQSSNFTIYGTKEVGEQFEVIESSTQDSRFTYGLTLGLHYAMAKEVDLGVELSINPSSDVKAFGVGGAISFFSIIKVGLGALWTKHFELKNQHLFGDLLNDAGELQTKETYGKANFYLSFSIIGWPPFTKE